MIKNDGVCNRRKLKWVLKLFFSGVFAFVIMTVFCLWYYNIPTHYPNISGATDYKWASNTFYSRCNEGFANGKTNNEGFINGFDYVEGMNIDILVMGSSHMEGYNVAQNENTASRLDTLLENKNVYNIGISGHTFLICCSNFQAAINYYDPSDIVMETSTLNFSEKELKSVLNSTFPEISNYSGGILGFLSKNQFLRLVYSQLDGFMRQVTEEDLDIVLNKRSQNADKIKSLDLVLSYIANIASNNGTDIIIFYHPTTQINSDGSLLLPDDVEDRKIFSNLCSKNGIIFLDMTERFRYEYETNHTLPHGFCNSSIGSGHLNKYGHKMIADELYKIIEKSR